MGWGPPKVQFNALNGLSPPRLSTRRHFYRHFTKSGARGTNINSRRVQVKLVSTQCSGGRQSKSRMTSHAFDSSVATLGSFNELFPYHFPHVRPFFPSINSELSVG